jgi:predicted nucleic-acid-binding protein
MLKKPLFLLPVLIFILSCSSGKKALQKGNYYQAIGQAVDRLKSDPDNEKASKVLTEGYPLAIAWSQEELDFALSSNKAFKWEQTIPTMQQVNRLSDIIRSTPAARKIISEPKMYTSELNMAYEKAASERYLAGINLLEQNSREAARTAFEHFYKADQFIPGYENVVQEMEIAKDLATYKVIIEAATVQSRTYKLTSEFFYNQVFEFLNNKYPERSFVNFYSPQQAERFQISQPDFIVKMEFFDFLVGNLVRNQKEEELIKRVQVETKDTTRVTYKTYKAKLKTFSDKVISGGRLNYRIIDFQTDNLLRDKLIPGSFIWENQYAIFVGDKQALSEKQFELTQNKALPLPPHQDLFIEFTRPIYENLCDDLDRFFRRYR